MEEKIMAWVVKDEHNRELIFQNKPRMEVSEFSAKPDTTYNREVTFVDSQPVIYGYSIGDGYTQDTGIVLPDGSIRKLLGMTEIPINTPIEL